MLSVIYIYIYIDSFISCLPIHIPGVWTQGKCMAWGKASATLRKSSNYTHIFRYPCPTSGGSISLNFRCGMETSFPDRPIDDLKKQTKIPFSAYRYLASLWTAFRLHKALHLSNSIYIWNNVNNDKYDYIYIYIYWGAVKIYYICLIITFVYNINLYDILDLSQRT